MNYYLVYLPSIKVIFFSDKREDCEKKYEEIGRDYNEDYRVMEDGEYFRLVNLAKSIR